MKPNYNNNKKPNQRKGKREKPKETLDVNPQDYNFCYAVRHTKLSNCNLFYSNDSSLISGEKVIIKTCSGLEHGSICNVLIEREKTDPANVIGIIERKATSSDNNILNHIKTQKEPEELEFCNSRIKSREMKMKLIDVEHFFSGEKIIFYFIADGRIDFRELVKDLARRYHTRIEMRQIGVRDEAKMLSDYEHCGRELCCRTFLSELDPVTMRMAKMQKTTLDPNKISGPCGRLMCCLRFEDEIYKAHKSELPRKGDTVYTNETSGRVINCKLLNKEVTFLTEDEGLVTVPLSEITKIEPKNIKDNSNLQNRGKRQLPEKAKSINKTENSSTSDSELPSSEKTEEQQNSSENDGETE